MKYKRPESVLVLVYNNAGEVLLMRRTKPADFIQSVTGGLAWGESAVQAARRELREETGIEAGNGLVNLHRQVSFPIKPAWRSRYGPSAQNNREHWFALRLPGRRLVRLNSREHSEYFWLPWPEAARLVTSWTNRDAIHHVMLSA